MLTKVRLHCKTSTPHLSAAGMSSQDLHHLVAEAIAAHRLGPQPAHHAFEQRAGVVSDSDAGQP